MDANEWFMTMETENRIAILVKTFPKVSETFILQELLALQSRNIAITIYSLLSPADTTNHSVNQHLKFPVHYMSVTDLRSFGRQVLAHCRTFVHAPIPYCNALMAAIESQRAAEFRHFLDAVSVAYRIRCDGIRHIHAHYADQPAAVAHLVEKLTGATYSVSAHAKDIYLSSKPQLRSRLADATFIVTCTEYNRAYLQRTLDANQVVVRSYHGIDTNYFDPVGRGTRRALPPLLLSVGRFREKKGLITLVDACRRLRDQGIDFECGIVGYGPLQSSIERQIAHHGLQEHVKMLGKLTHRELRDLYARAYAFVLPCQIAADGDRDGIPNVLLEAMAMELAVVTTPVSGIPEAVKHGRNGLLIEPQNVDALAAAILRLLDDPVFAFELGRRGRLTVSRQFSNATNINTLVTLLEQQFKSPKRRYPLPNYAATYSPEGAGRT